MDSFYEIENILLFLKVLYVLSEILLYLVHLGVREIMELRKKGSQAMQVGLLGSHHLGQLE